MKKCLKCGSRLSDTATYCPKCGSKEITSFMDVAKEEEINKENNGFNPVIQKEEQYNKDVINQNHFYNQNSTPSRQIPQIVDEPSGGMCFLCLLFPAIGLIVGLSCQYQKPKTSNEYLKYTAIGVGIFIGLSILLALLNFIVSKL